MNDHHERLKKIQILSRLRKFERDASAFLHLRNEYQLHEKNEVFNMHRNNYESALVGQNQGGVYNPDMHSWRLSAIENLRSSTLEAEAELGAARTAYQSSRNDLARKELEKKVANYAEQAAEKESDYQFLLKEHDEILDLQLFRLQAAS